MIVFLHKFHPLQMEPTITMHYPPFFAVEEAFPKFSKLDPNEDRMCVICKEELVDIYAHQINVSELSKTNNIELTLGLGVCESCAQKYCGRAKNAWEKNHCYIDDLDEKVDLGLVVVSNVRKSLDLPAFCLQYSKKGLDGALEDCCEEEIVQLRKRVRLVIDELIEIQKEMMVVITSMHVMETKFRHHCKMPLYYSQDDDDIRSKRRTMNYQIFDTNQKELFFDKAIVCEKIYNRFKIVMKHKLNTFL